MAARGCRPGEHRDVLLRGRRRVRCVKCGQEFPCSHACEHLDCQAARDDEEFLRAVTDTE